MTARTKAPSRIDLARCALRGNAVAAWPAAMLAAATLMPAPATMAAGPHPALRPATERPPPRHVACQILAARHGHQISLDGRITATSKIGGSYTLRARKTGAGNASSITQSGTFSAAPGQPARVGTIVLGGAGTTRAMLELSWHGGTAVCILNEGERL